jgi:hypothetical protein
MQDVPLYAGAKTRAGAKVVDYALDLIRQPLRVMQQSRSNSTRL